MTQFYVYGLIDPRTSSIFYIGKGKGKRVFQHLVEKENVHSNLEKLKIIKEIYSEGLVVRHIIIGENLNEEASLLLERLLIYRIGRKIFDEGCLTNIVPGGKWHREAPIFIKIENIPSIEFISEHFPELLPILDKYPHVAKEFIALRCPYNSDDETLYVYNDKGEKLHEWDISHFIQIFGLGNAIDLINVLKNNSNPVYAWSRIWSKSKFESFDDISKIPFQNFDTIDFNFVRQVNKLIIKEDDILLDCFYSNGNKHIEIKLSTKSNEMYFTYFYLNSNKKHSSNFLEEKLNGKCFNWYSDGQIKEEVEYSRNNILSKKSYFPSGDIEIIEKFDEGTGKSIKIWYKNRQLRYENKDGMSFSYSEKGVILSKGIRSGNLHEGGNLLIWEYAEDGMLTKEIKQYQVNGLLHGYEKNFFDTGEVKREVDYTNGYNNKIVKSYKKNGEVKIK